jgi:uncharacterized Zn finger protein
MRAQITPHAPLPMALLCPDCGSPVALKLVELELSLPNRWFDIYTLECTKCGHIHCRTIDPYAGAGLA